MELSSSSIKVSSSTLDSCPRTLPGDDIWRLFANLDRRIANLELQFGLGSCPSSLPPHIRRKYLTVEEFAVVEPAEHASLLPQSEARVPRENWKAIRNKYFPAGLLATKDVEAMYDEQWFELRRQLLDGKCLWSACDALVCAHVNEEKLFKSKAELFQKESCIGVRRALEALNTLEGHVACPEGFCVVFSERAGVYVLCCRFDKRVSLASLPDRVFKANVVQIGRVVDDFVQIGQNRAIISAAVGIDVSIVKSAKPFQDWVDSISGERRIEVTRIHIQSLDLFGPKVGFIKFKADATVDARTVPGIVFLRGGAVAILVILYYESRKFTLVVRQARVPVCSSNLVEIPAGMLDGVGNFAGVAAKEMKEETGIEIKENDLIDMTELAFSKRYPGMFPTCGASDEFNRIFLYQKRITQEEFRDLNGKLTGVLEEGESIKLEIILLDKLWRISADAKSLVALCLYKKLTDAGLLPKADLPKEEVAPSARKKGVAALLKGLRSGAVEKIVDTMEAEDQKLLLPSALKSNGKKEKKRKVWSKECSTSLPQDDEKVQLWKSRGLLLDPKKISSVADAVKHLNRSPDSKGGYCVVYSSRTQLYYGLFKRGFQSQAYADFGVPLRWCEKQCVEICSWVDGQIILGKAILLDTNRFKKVDDAVNVLNFPFDLPYGDEGSEIYEHVGTKPYCVFLDETKQTLMLLYTMAAKEEAFRRFNLEQGDSSPGFFNKLQGWIFSKWVGKPNESKEEKHVSFDMQSLVNKHFGDMNSRYEVVRPLGSGIQGTTTLVRRRRRRSVMSDDLSSHTSDLYVAKEPIDTSEKGRSDSRRELEILSLFRHPNCLRVFELVEEEEKETGGERKVKRPKKGRFVIITEFAEGGDLYSYLHTAHKSEGSEGCIDENILAAMFKQAMSGLAHLHASDLVHNDLKPENMLVMTKYERNVTPRVVIGDFGCASFENEQKKMFFGDPRYLSPEAMRGFLLVLNGGVLKEKPGKPSDIWAMGVTIFGALAGDRQPFLYERCRLQDLKIVFEKLSEEITGPKAVEFPDWTCSEDSISLLKDMLCKDQGERPIAIDVLKYDWFEGDAATPGKSVRLDHIRFASIRNRARQILRNAIAIKLKYEEVQFCHEVFCKFDPDHSGKIDREEFKDVWQQCGKIGADEVFDAADVDDSGQLDFNEFATLWLDWSKFNGEMLSECLELVVDDIGFGDGDDTIAVDKFREMFEEQLGPNEDLKEALQQMDTDADGRISFDELKRFIQGDKPNLNRQDMSPESGLYSKAVSTWSTFQLSDTQGLDWRYKPVDRNRLKELGYKTDWRSQYIARHSTCGTQTVLLERLSSSPPATSQSLGVAEIRHSMPPLARAQSDPDSPEQRYSMPPRTSVVTATEKNEVSGSPAKKW